MRKLMGVVRFALANGIFLSESKDSIIMGEERLACNILTAEFVL